MHFLLVNKIHKRFAMKKKLTKEQFINLLSEVKEATSVQGKHYSNIRLEKGKIVGTRNGTKGTFEIDINKLYDAYKNCETINTSTLKPYVNRVQSPAYAILMKMKLA